MLTRALLLLLVTATPALAQTIYSNDFETGDVAGWTTPAITNPLFQRPITIASNPLRNIRFLGDFGDQGIAFATGGLPLHDSVVVELDLYVIRSWDGNRSNSDGPDVMTITDGSRGRLLRTSFTNKEDLRQAYPDAYPGGDHPAFSGAAAVGALGYAEGDAIYHLRFAYPHNAGTIALTLEAELDDRFPMLTNESWGIDNISIAVIPPRPASATIEAGIAAAAPGEQVLVPIYIRDAVSVAGSGATSVRTTVRFDASLLVPESPTPLGRLEGRERVIDIELPLFLAGDSSIGLLVFRAAVGDDTVTALRLEKTSANGGEILFRERPGRFRLRGLCVDGGTRLFREEHAVLLRPPFPNPMRQRASVAFALAVDGPVRLELVDAAGRSIATLLDADVTAGEHSVSVAGLAAGRYVLRIVAGFETREQVLLVVR